MTADPCVRKAIHWEPLDGGKVRCVLCAHSCVVGEGKTGICGVRRNDGGELFTLVYGRLVAERPDPVEKKPLFHFLPGTLTHSVATAGCNMHCANCQNYAISQVAREVSQLPGIYSDPVAVAQRAVGLGAQSVSCTYTEPTVFLEFGLDLMREAKALNLKTVFVSNGFMSPEARGSVEGLLDAANVDLKSMEDGFYRKICGARLAPVLETIAALKAMGVWVEVTTLVIPGENDSDAQLAEVAKFIASVDREMPWHVSAFHPDYKMLDKPPTPVATLSKAREIGLAEGLRFVYQGNRPGGGGEDTQCPSCGRTAIGRRGYTLSGLALDDRGNCRNCGSAIPGVFA